jgi:hypothetical protein
MYRLLREPLVVQEAGVNERAQAAVLVVAAWAWRSGALAAEGVREAMIEMSRQRLGQVVDINRLTYVEIVVVSVLAHLEMVKTQGPRRRPRALLAMGSIDLAHLRKRSRVSTLEARW